MYEYTFKNYPYFYLNSDLDLSVLNDKINISSFDYIIYPETHSNIMEVMKDYFSKYNTNFIELKKKNVNIIEFDFSGYFSLKKYNRNDKKRIKEYVGKCLEEAKSYNYFSIAMTFKKPKYRKYVKKFSFIG